MEDTYQRMRFRDAFSVRWRERIEAPLRVALLDILLDAIFLSRVLLRYAKKASSKVPVPSGEPAK